MRLTYNNSKNKISWKRLTFVVALLCLALAACQPGESETPTLAPTVPLSTSESAPVPDLPTEAIPSPTTAVQTVLNESFSLAVGESFSIEQVGLVITFVQVTGDNRCPSAVTCVQNGPVMIEILVEQNGDSSTFEMNPDPNLAALEGQSPNIVTFQDFEIELTAVNPYPEQPEDLLNMDYSATFLVR